MLCYASYISLPRYFYLMHNGESEGDEAEWWNRDILQSETLCNFLYVNVSSSIEEAGIYIFSSKTFCNFPNVNVSSLKGGVGQILGTLVTSMTWVLALSYLLWRFEILFYMNTWTSFYTFFTWVHELLFFIFYAGVSKSCYISISILIKYSNFSRFYKKNGSIL